MVATLPLQSGNREQTSSEAEPQGLPPVTHFLQRFHFLKIPQTAKIAVLIEEDQVFKHMSLLGTFPIKPQQLLKALAWFLNNS